MLGVGKRALIIIFEMLNVDSYAFISFRNFPRIVRMNHLPSSNKI